MATQASNPFYVKQGYADFGDGLQDVVKDYTEQKKAEEQKAANIAKMQEAKEIINSGDNQKIADFMLLNPGISEQVNQNLGIRSDMQKQGAIGDAKKILLSNDPRQELVGRVQRIAESGGDATQTIQLLNKAPDEMRSEALTYLSLFDPASADAYRKSQAPSMPKYSNIKETASGGLMGLNENTGAYEQIKTPEALRAKTPLVQIGGADIGEEQKQLAKSNVARFNTIREKADSAREQMSSLEILDSIEVQQGALEPLKQSLAAYGSSLGIDTTALANVPAGQAFTAEANKMVLTAQQAQKGPQTESDTALIRKTVNSLRNDPRANKFIGNVAMAQSRRSIEHSDFMENYLQENGKIAGSTRAWNEFKRSTPTVSKFQKTPEGLPLFFFRFKDRVKEANPEASDQDIIEAWRDQEKKSKGRK